VPAPPPLDVRRVRFERAAIAIVLLAAYVFRQGWLIAAVAAVLGVAAAGGPSTHLFYFLFDVLVAPRLGPPREFEDPVERRFASLLAVAVLSAATFLWAVGVGPLAWALALAEAAAAAVEATTGVSVGKLLYARLRERRR